MNQKLKQAVVGGVIGAAVSALFIYRVIPNAVFERALIVVAVGLFLGALVGAGLSLGQKPSNDVLGTEAPGLQRVKRGFAGGVVGAITSVTLAQWFIPGVNSSQQRTLLAVAVGFALGAVAGAALQLAPKKPQPE